MKIIDYEMFVLDIVKSLYLGYNIRKECDKDDKGKNYGNRKCLCGRCP